MSAHEVHSSRVYAPRSSRHAGSYLVTRYSNTDSPPTSNAQDRRPRPPDIWKGWLNRRGVTACRRVPDPTARTRGSVRGPGRRHGRFSLGEAVLSSSRGRSNRDAWGRRSKSSNGVTRRRANKAAPTAAITPRRPSQSAACGRVPKTINVTAEIPRARPSLAESRLRLRSIGRIGWFHHLGTLKTFSGSRVPPKLRGRSSDSGKIPDAPVNFRF